MQRWTKWLCVIWDGGKQLPSRCGKWVEVGEQYLDKRLVVQSAVDEGCAMHYVSTDPFPLCQPVIHTLLLIYPHLSQQ